MRANKTNYPLHSVYCKVLNSVSKSKVPIILGVLLLISACAETNDSTKNTFDRKAFLSEVVSVQILPSIEVFHSDVEDLDKAIKALIEAPSEATVESAKNTWKVAYLSWQAVSIFNIGPAAAQGLKKSLFEEVGTFPISESKIKSRIETGIYNLNDFDRDARGLFTLEYLLFAHDLIENSNTYSFLEAVSSDIFARSEALKKAWDAQQITDYIENNGTDAGSSTSAYYNEYVKSFEVLKNFKIGLPLGLRAGQTQREPKLIEAYYSEVVSLQGLKMNFEKIKQIWLGPENGIGFKGYLKTVTGGPALIENTQNQFAAVDSVFSRLNLETEIMIDLVEANDERLVSLHTEMQKLTRYLKSELSSLIGIAITYSSSDGD